MARLVAEFTFGIHANVTVLLLVEVLTAGRSSDLDVMLDKAVLLLHLEVFEAILVEKRLFVTALLQKSNMTFIFWAVRYTARL